MEGDDLFAQDAVSLMPNGHFQFLTAPLTSTCIKVSPLVICYCDKQLGKGARFPIPLRFVLLIRRWFLRVGKAKASALIHLALSGTKQGSS